MTAYHYEVRSSSKPDGEGELLEPSRYATRENAEKAAERESRLGFFSNVWRVGVGMYGETDYLCEYAAAEVAV